MKKDTSCSPRTHYCGNIELSLESKEVSLYGWVDRRRDHGGVIFIDLRDREGIVQIVFDPDLGEYFALADQVRSEYVLHVKGQVRARSKETINTEMKTGQSGGVRQFHHYTQLFQNTTIST